MKEVMIEILKLVYTANRQLYIGKYNKLNISEITGLWLIQLVIRLFKGTFFLERRSFFDPQNILWPVTQNLLYVRAS